MRARLLSLIGLLLISQLALAGGNGIEIGGSKGRKPGDLPDGVPQQRPIPAPAQKAGQRYEHSTPPMLFIAETKFASYSVQEGDVLQLSVDVVSSQPGQVAGCWATLVAPELPGFEIPMDSCVARKTGPTNYTLNLTYRVPVPSVSRVLKINEIAILNRAEEGVEWGKPYRELGVTIRGSAQDRIDLTQVWYETPSGTDLVPQGETFNLVAETRSFGKITYAQLVYTIDEGKGPELRVQELARDPGTWEPSPDGKPRQSGDLVRFSLSFFQPEQRHMRFAPVQLILFNQALQYGKVMLPGEIPVRSPSIQ